MEAPLSPIDRFAEEYSGLEEPLTISESVSAILRYPAGLMYEVVEGKRRTVLTLSTLILMTCLLGYGLIMALQSVSGTTRRANPLHQSERLLLKLLRIPLGTPHGIHDILNLSSPASGTRFCCQEGLNCYNAPLLQQY